MQPHSERNFRKVINDGLRLIPEAKTAWSSRSIRSLRVVTASEVALIQANHSGFSRRTVREYLEKKLRGPLGDYLREVEIGPIRAVDANKDYRLFGAVVTKPIDKLETNREELRGLFSDILREEVELGPTDFSVGLFAQPKTDDPRALIDYLDWDLPTTADFFDTRAHPTGLNPDAGMSHRTTT